VKEIKMVDLGTQYQRIKQEIDNAMAEVLQSTAFIKGPQVKTFEDSLAKYLSVKHVIGCANGTDALQIAMMALGYQPGDEVITPAFTYAATVEVIKLLKLVPTYVDVDPHTFNMNVSQIEAAITPRTKAIVPVHLFGQVADMEPIMAIAAKHNLHVIEDNAQAIGADYTFANGSKLKAGTIGHIGTTSFFPSKNLGCYGDGGAIFTNDDAIATRLKMMANHGQSSQYVFDEIGVNSRLDTLQAAVLNVKLKYLDQYCAARQAVAAYYDAALKDVAGIEIPYRASNSTHVFHQYNMKVNVNRDELRKKLADKGIPSMVYYPSPMHVQKAYMDERYTVGSFPVGEALSKQVLALPIHTEMQNEEQDYIIENLINAIKNTQ
jgi:UDP-2-acetamido-2-deoxy-ribo-hexuluronate aminotransferase